MLTTLISVSGCKFKHAFYEKNVVVETYAPYDQNNKSQPFIDF